MRITDFPILHELKEEYIHLRRDGNSREEAVQLLLTAYSDEITIGAEDDGLLFWIGVADAQYHRKELSGEVAKNALAALDKLQYSEWDLCVGDLDRRRRKYAEAPMPERKVGKPKPPFSCGWEVGDTYAYRMKGEVAKQVKIDGVYALFRTLYTAEFDKRIVPVVTITFWGNKPFPANAEDFSRIPAAILCTGGRFGSPKHKFEYRAILTFANKRQLDGLDLEYVGNFKDVSMPEDEIIFTNPACLCITLPKMIDRALCVYWEYNDYFSSHIKKEDKRKKYVFLKVSPH